MPRKMLKYIPPLLVVYFLLQSISGDWQTVWEQIKAVKIVYLALSFLVALTIYPEAAYAWQKLINKLFGISNTKKSMSIWLISNTSRYIPGTIWQYLGRIELGKRILKLNRKQVLISLALEALLVLLSASMLSGFVLYFIYPSPIYLLFVFAPLILFNKQIYSHVIKSLNKIFNKDFSSKTKLNYSEIYTLLSWFVLNFILNAVSIWLLLFSFNIRLSFSGFIYLIGAYSASWLVGYLAVIVPGGLGVVEGVLTILLTQISIPAAIGSLLALIYRLVLTIAELVIFLTVYYKGDWNEKRT